MSMDPEPSNYLEAQAWLAKARQAKRLAAQALDSEQSSPSKSKTFGSSPQGSGSSSTRTLKETSTRNTLHSSEPLTPSSSQTAVPSSPSSSPKSSKVHGREYNYDGEFEEEAPVEVTLSAEQKHIIKVVKSGKNVFFTGPAGTGKSVVLREIISWARSQPGSKDALAITAPTGIAGVNIGGRSLHSWSGIELGKEDAMTLVRRIQGAKARIKRWEKVRILIIDEISMVDGNLFDKLDTIARTLRDPDLPFGGIQLVLTGDFFQLPPVPEKSYNYSMPSTFAFQSKAWSQCISSPIFLKQVFRQKDNTFVEILSAIREGRVTGEHMDILRRLDRTVQYTDGIEASQLFPRRDDVERYNSTRLAELSGETVVYKAIDTGGFDVFGNRIPFEETRKLVANLVALESLTLKVGAQVMLIQNILQGGERQLVNGSTGIITEFLTVRDAIERCMNIAGINPEETRFQGTNEEKFIEVTKKLNLITPDVHYRAYRKYTGFSVEERWPLVHFTNGRDLLCTPTNSTVVGIKGNVEATRSQVPLILAWAISIHKAQGQTLPRVKIDLARIFEKGQAYVALSRATSLDGLEIRNLNPGKISAHPLVLQWHQFWSSLGEFDEEFMDEELSGFFAPMDEDDF